jgi:hypothetical protein
MDCERHLVEEREEQRDPASYRLFKAFMRGSFEGTLNTPGMKLVDTDCVREVAQRIVMDVAEAGNVRLDRACLIVSEVLKMAPTGMTPPIL